MASLSKTVNFAPHIGEGEQANLIMDITAKLLAWYQAGETGISSKHMAAVASGIASRGSHPLDPADLNRCIKLVKAVPELREHFAAIASTSALWKAVIDHRGCSCYPYLTTLPQALWSLLLVIFKS